MHENHFDSLMLNRPYISLVPIVCWDNYIMEYAQDEDIFFHLENMLYQLSLNFNTLVLRNTP